MASCLTIGLAQRYSYMPTLFLTETFGRNKRWEVQASFPIPSGTWRTDLNSLPEPKLGTEEISFVGRNFYFHRHISWDFTHIGAYPYHFRIAAFSCNSFWQASPDGTEVRGTEQPSHWSRVSTVPISRKFPLVETDAKENLMADGPTYQVADIPMIWKRQAGTGGAGAAFHGQFLFIKKI